MEPSLYLKTPIFKSHKLKKELNLNIFYKMECHQPTGSFKIRGMEELCRFYIQQGKNNFIASSGGNAGYSLAYVGNKLGAEITVVVPKTTSQFMIDKIMNLNARVEVYGNVWDEAHEHALKLAQRDNAVYVSPFDDPLLWKGHASMIDECAESMKQPDRIILSVGGGGLLCGVLEGMKRNGWQNTKVITAETEGAASFYESHKAGRQVELSKITSIATSLGAKKVAEKSLELAMDFDITPITMPDDKAVDAALAFLNEYNALVEPACGAALSIPYFYSNLIEESEKVLIIVCGGVNTSIEKYMSIKGVDV